jgi:hypothetical protein
VRLVVRAHPDEAFPGVRRPIEVRQGTTRCNGVRRTPGSRAATIVTAGERSTSSPPPITPPPEQPRNVFGSKYWLTSP